MLSAQVISDLREFFSVNWDSFQSEAKEYDGLDITVSTNDEGDRWAYQTGDNSYTGSCYFHPHWAVTTITEDSTPEKTLNYLVDQLEDLLCQ